MSTHALYNSLLRPPILHILRAAGFHAIRPAVLDTIVDLASRYLILIAQKTAAHALTNRNESIPTIIDVRLALQDVGAFRPQMSIMEEQCEDEEDMRGVDAFLRWLTGEENREIRRIAGLLPSEGEVVALEASEPREDFLTGMPPMHSTMGRYELMVNIALKKKHSKTGEESRYQGTAIGKPADEGTVLIEGGKIDSIRSWNAIMHQRRQGLDGSLVQNPDPAMATSDSSPLSDISSKIR